KSSKSSPSEVAPQFSAPPREPIFFSDNDLQAPPEQATRLVLITRRSVPARRAPPTPRSADAADPRRWHLPSVGYEGHELTAPAPNSPEWRTGLVHKRSEVRRCKPA